jgi:hypothetical protein
MAFDPDAKGTAEVDDLFVGKTQLSCEFVDPDFCWHVLEITSGSESLRGQRGDCSSYRHTLEDPSHRADTS